MARKIKEQTEQQWKDHADEVNLIRTMLINQITTRQHAESRKETDLLSKALKYIDSYRSALGDRACRQGVSFKVWYPAHIDQHGNDIGKEAASAYVDKQREK